MSVKLLSNPAMIAPITMTTMMPMATPRIVSAARSLCARNDERAMPTPSRVGVMGSFLAQRRDGIQLRCSTCRDDAGGDTGEPADQQSQHHGNAGQRGGKRRDRLEGERQQDTEEDARQAAETRERHRFDQELPQDVAPA